MYAFMSKVKLIVNSHLLTRASDSIGDLEGLTANQFLIERRSSSQIVGITLK